MLLADQLGEVCLARVATSPGQPDDLAHGGTAVLSHVVDDQQGHRRQRGDDQPLAFTFAASLCFC